MFLTLGANLCIASQIIAFFSRLISVWRLHRPILAVSIRACGTPVAFYQSGLFERRELHGHDYGVLGTTSHEPYSDNPSGPCA